MAVDPQSSLAYKPSGATGQTTPPIGAPTGTTPPGNPFAAASPFLMIAGALTGAIGSFYAAKSAQYEARSAAVDQDYEASLTGMSARQAEQQAHDYMVAYQQAAQAKQNPAPATKKKAV